MTMIARSYIPNPPLSEFVALFWLYEDYSQPHALERLLPTGTMELVINLRENEARIYDQQNMGRYQTLPGTLICGAHSEYFVIDTEGQNAVMGVHFQPGGAFPFFKLPASELRNTQSSLALRVRTSWRRTPTLPMSAHRKSVPKKVSGVTLTLVSRSLANHDCE